MNPMVGFVSLFGAAVLFSLTIINDRLSRGALLRGQMAINPAYRRAGTAARNADVVEAMGMMPTIVQSWHEASEAAMHPQTIASRRAAIVRAVSKRPRMVHPIAILTAAAWQVTPPSRTQTPDNRRTA